MGLTIHVTGADEYGRYLKVLVCGDPGSGKTRSSSCWPNPLLASINANLMSVADKAMPWVPIHSSADLLQLRHTLDNPPEVRAEKIGRPVDTLVIDTIDHFQQMLATERRRDEKKDVLAGADWGWLGDEMRAILRGLRNLPVHVVLLCHLKLTEDQESGRVFLRPSMQGAVGDEIAGYVDVAMAFKAVTTLEVAPDGQSSQRVVHRFAQTYPDPTLPWVRDNSGNLPPEFPIDFETDYQRLHEAVFGNVNLAASSVLGTIAEVAQTRQPDAAAQSQQAAKATKAPAAKKAAAPVAPVAPPAKAAGVTISAQVNPTPEIPEPTVQPTPEQVPDPVVIKPVEPPPADSEDALAEELAMELMGEPAPAVVGEPVVRQVTDAEAMAAGQPKEAVSNGKAPELPQEEAPERPPCESCGGRIESDDQLDLSKIRFRKPLCRTCFIDAKRAPVGAK